MVADVALGDRIDGEAAGMVGGATVPHAAMGTRHETSAPIRKSYVPDN
jgi:hypothetical protein